MKRYNNLFDKIVNIDNIKSYQFMQEDFQNRNFE